MSNESRSPRVALQLGVRPETRAVLEELREQTGVPLVEMTTRVLDWFAQQPKTVRREILERGDVSGEISRLYVGELLAGPRGQEVAESLTPDQTLAAMEALCAKLRVDLHSAKQVAKRKG